jgi:hypothetical protein
LLFARKRDATTEIPRDHPKQRAAAASEAGFGDLSYFNQAFRRRYDVAPSDVRARGASQSCRQSHINGKSLAAWAGGPIWLMVLTIILHEN